MEVKLEIKMEFEMEVEMEAPILQSNYMGAQGAHVYADGKIGASISTSNLTSISTSPFLGNIGPGYHYREISAYPVD